MAARPPAAPAGAVFSPHALLPAEGRVLVHDTILPGETLHAYLERTGLLTRIAHQPVRLTVDGHRVPRELWRHCRPKSGTLIGITAVVHGGGGGGGKNPIATVLGLAIAVFNPGAMLLKAFDIANTAIIGSLTLGKVIDFGLGLVVSAIFPAPMPDLSAAQGAGFGGVTSPTYSLSGGSNRPRPYEPLPVIAGTHRVVPDLGARTYTEFEGDDQYLYQVFEFGYNTVTLSDWRIGSSPLSGYNEWEMQESGTDGALTLFPTNVDTIAGATLDTVTPIVRTSSAGTTALALDFEGPLYGIGGTGQIVGQTMAFDLEYRAVGSATWLDFEATKNVSIRAPDGDRAPIRRTYRREVALGQYEVRVTRTTLMSDFVANNFSVEISWSQLRSYQPDSADYNGRKRVALKIKANGQISGQVSQLSAVARAQCPVWTGAAWVTQETSNPAWWYRAIALGRFVTIDGVSRRVWGAGLPSARVDDASIKAWGAWCDSKQLTFNGVFDRPMSAYDMLQAIAVCGRASSSWANGKLGVVYDQASQPVTAVFGMPNIVAGSFGISYATEQLADEILVNFINPDLDWQRDTVRCLVPGTTTPTRTRQIELFGCTSLQMAARAGNLYAAQNAYRARRYTWRSDFEAMPVARGDVVRLAHDLTSYDYSGRLVEGSTASVLKLDRQVSLDPAGTWVTLIEPDGTMSTHAVAGGSGLSDTLTLSSALAFNPGADPSHVVYDYKWLYDATATPGVKVKIDSIKPVSESEVELVAFDELDIFYTAEDNPYDYTPPRPNYGAVQISNLAVTETGVKVANGYMVSLAVTWDAVNDYTGAELWAAVNGGPELSRGFTTGRRIDFTVADGDTVALRLVARSSLTRLAGTVQLTLDWTVSFADNFPPSDVSSFLIAGDALSWTPVDDVDIAGYRVRFNYGANSDWGAATALHEGLLTASPWAMPVRPAGAVTLMIKAVDVAGIESTNTADIYTDLGDPVVQRIVQTVDFDALGYPGTITGGTVSGGDVVASSATAFWPADDSVAVWGADSATFWPAAVYSAVTYEAQVSPTSATDGSTMTIDAAITGTIVTIEYRPDGPGAFWGADSGGAFWGADADAFWPDPPDYQPWPGAVTVSNQPYDVRVSISGGATQGRISTMTVTIDAPFVEEGLNDVVISAGGTRLPITRSYRAIDNVQLTVQADGNGAVSARIEDKSATLGPLIKTINDAGVAVAGLVDARIRGY